MFSQYLKLGEIHLGVRRVYMINSILFAKFLKMKLYLPWKNIVIYLYLMELMIIFILKLYINFYHTSKKINKSKFEPS